MTDRQIYWMRLSLKLLNLTRPDVPGYIDYWRGEVMI